MKKQLIFYPLMVHEFLAYDVITLFENILDVVEAFDSMAIDIAGAEDYLQQPDGTMKSIVVARMVTIERRILDA